MNGAFFEALAYDAGVGDVRRRLLLLIGNPEFVAGFRSKAEDSNRPEADIQVGGHNVRFGSF